MYEIIMGQSPLSKNYTEDYKYDILVQGNADLKDGKVIPRIYTKQVTKLAKPNSIIFTVRAPVGQIAINTKKVVIGRGVCSIEGDKFLYHKLEQLNNIKYWNKFSTGSTFDSINSNDLKNMVLHIPKNIEEKNRISHILDILDSMITLHNKKLKFLKKLENAYSVCLFAFKNNAPLVRFSNFNNDWEMFKVKDLFTVTRGQVLSVDKISKFKTDNNKFPVYSSQTHNNGLLGYYHDFLFDTAITWTTDGANAGTVKFRSGKFYSTNVNGVLISDDGYACEAVAKIIEKETPRWVVRVGNPKLMNNVMSDITIKISSDVNELEKISSILVKLNTRIELEKDIIEKYENLKKEYLNYLFI